MKITLRRGLMALGGVLVVINVTAAVWDVHIDRGRTEVRARRDLSNLSKLLSEQTAAALEAVDLVLRDAVRDGTAVKARAMTPQLRDEMLHIPQVTAFLVIDPDGRVVGRTNETRATNDELADRAYFAAHRDGHAGGLFISDPYQGGADGTQWRFVMSRRLDARRGAFGGVIAAIMEIENFDRLYRTIDIGEGGFITLRTRDGTLLTRVPDQGEPRGRKFRNPEIFAAVGQEGRFLGWSRSPLLDNQRVLLSAVAVRGFPLEVRAGATEEAVFAPWQREAWRVALRTLLTSAAMLGLIALAALELARREREREEMQRQLQQAAKMEAIGRLAGGIAHDFNNILGAILGYGEMAQKVLGEGNGVRRYVDQVMQAGARGKGLVERILAFSRSGLGERVPVHVQSVVEETLDILAASLLPQVRLQKRLDAGDTAIVGDATQLHQVTMNLCTNALQAMEHGGVLTVVLEKVAVRERRLLLSNGALAAGPYVRLSVSDTGGGIPPAVLERMFDAFFTTKGVGDGTGLGLSLVHGIVADFGGAIDVATQAGAGTTFTVWLPAAGETPRLLAEPMGELPQGNGETVMIVDDERSLVALAEETLAALGYEPMGFDSSVAALQAFRAEPQRFDLVLTDETMPDLSGVELAREMRRVRPELPIVLMSGYSGAQLTERARATGVAEVLRKPLVRRDIAEALGRALHPATASAGA
jgi:signal transduction histidine kinase/ActR/RegA family two-component response regulator